MDFWLTTEDLPDPENRVTPVDRSGKVTLSYTPNNQVPTRKLYDQLKSCLGHLGMRQGYLIPRNVYMKTAVPIAGCAHQAGTWSLSAAMRRPQCWNEPAERTSLIISTSWTRVSSSASEQ